MVISSYLNVNKKESAYNATKPIDKSLVLSRENQARSACFNP